MQKKSKITTLAAVLAIFAISTTIIVNNTNENNIESQKIVTTIHGSMPNYTLEMLAAGTEYAIIGEVQKIKPVIVETHTMGPLVYSDVLVKVEKDLNKKYSDRKITVRIQGGELGDRKTISDSMPTFKIGERVMFFVPEKEPDSIWGDNYYVAGFYQGKYSLSDGHATRNVVNDQVDEKELISQIKQIRDSKQ